MTAHPGVLDLDAGNAGLARGDRHGELLKQRVIDMNVESFGLKGSEAIGDGG